MDFEIIKLVLASPIVLGVAVATWLLTYLIKYPIKKATSKIRNDTKRKQVNKLILLLPFIIACILIFVYNGLTTKQWLLGIEDMLLKAFSSSVLAITIYNIFEGIRGKKTEYETTEDGKALYNLLIVYAKDKDKVRLLLDQCKNNYLNGDATISETVKGFLPKNVDQDAILAITKGIEKYLKDKLKNNLKLEVKTQE